MVDCPAACGCGRREGLGAAGLRLSDGARAWPAAWAWRSMTPRRVAAGAEAATSKAPGSKPTLTLPLPACPVAVEDIPSGGQKWALVFTGIGFGAIVCALFQVGARGLVRACRSCFKSLGQAALQAGMWLRTAGCSCLVSALRASCANNAQACGCRPAAVLLFQLHGAEAGAARARADAAGAAAAGVFARRAAALGIFAGSPLPHVSPPGPAGAAVMPECLAARCSLHLL